MVLDENHYTTYHLNFVVKLLQNYLTTVQKTKKVSKLKFLSQKK